MAGAVLVSVLMGDIETYLRLRNSGIALVEHIPGTPDKLRVLGADAADATELSHLNQVYFGPTRFSGKPFGSWVAVRKHHLQRTFGRTWYYRFYRHRR